ncbi:hypothetical protein [Haliangium sp.]
MLLFSLAACVPDESKVSSSRQLRDLNGEEIWYLGDWAQDALGGSERSTLCTNNDPDPFDNTTCERVVPSRGEWIDIVTDWQQDFLESGCPLTVGDFEALVHQIADSPCDLSYRVSNGFCAIGLDYTGCGD